MATRVVIAEDEAIIRLDLKETLEEEGYEVVGETGRGDEAGGQGLDGEVEDVGVGVAVVLAVEHHESDRAQHPDHGRR